MKFRATLVDSKGSATLYVRTHSIGMAARAFSGSFDYAPMLTKGDKFIAALRSG